MKISEMLFIALLLLLAVSFIVVLLSYGNQQRNDYETCSLTLDLKFKTWKGTMDYPFYIERDTTGNMFCCMKEKSITEEGALINKCVKSQETAR